MVGGVKEDYRIDLALSLGRTTGRAITSSSSGRVVAFGLSQKQPTGKFIGPSPLHPDAYELRSWRHPRVCIEDLHADPLQRHQGQVTWADTYECLGRCRGMLCICALAGPSFSRMGDDSVLLDSVLAFFCLGHGQVHLHSTAISMQAWHTRPRAHGILHGDLLSGHQPARHLLSVLHLTWQAELGLTRSPVCAPPRPTATCRHATLRKDPPPALSARPV